MNLGIKNIRHNFKDLHHYSIAKADIETAGVFKPFQLGLRHMLLSLIPIMLFLLQRQLRQSPHYNYLHERDCLVVNPDENVAFFGNSLFIFVVAFIDLSKAGEVSYDKNIFRYINSTKFCCFC